MRFASTFVVVSKLIKSWPQVTKGFVADTVGAFEWEHEQFAEA